jgi:hypothetical protein
MDQRLTKIKQCESRIEQALWSVEVVGDNEGALEAYKAAEAELRALLADAAPSEMAETQRVLAYCLMREGNVLRVVGRAEEAGRLSEEEIEAARACSTRRKRCSRLATATTTSRAWDGAGSCART